MVIGVVRMKYVLIYLAVINIIAFAMYGIDKSKAEHNKWRISEKALILVAVFGGSIGAYSGMQVFRHKTKHLKFTIGVPVIFVLQILLGILIWSI